MSYGNIDLSADERALVLSILENALKENDELQASTQDDEELAFYRNARSKIRESLTAVRRCEREISLSEQQLTVIKGILNASYRELRVAYQAARAGGSTDIEAIRSEWIVRDTLSAKLDAPLIADTTCDSGESIFESD